MTGARIAQKNAAAFSLVEVCIAMGLAAFCLVAILGLLPTGLSTDQATLEQTAASGIASAIVADLRTTPLSATKSPDYGINIPATSQQIQIGDDGSPVVAGTQPRYLAYVTATPPTDTKAATLVRILITWPAAADMNNNPPKNFAGSYEVTTALDRN
jgi:uncharacterized protein (TIGR02598 family)